MIRNLLFITLLLFLPLSSWAAILYLEPATGEYYQGESFIAEIKIDNEGECINTVQADLSFSQDVLKVIDFSQGNSILSFWVEEPEISQSTGFISFLGGVPGGYCGRIPGDPGESNLLGKIIFEVKSQEFPSAEVNFSDTSLVLLNDGLGTPANLSFKKALFTIMPGIPEVLRQEWHEQLREDQIPPEKFEILINQDQAMFDGKHFIIFYTIDKETGLDYFEVKEGEKEWQIAASPYLLKDQTLQSKILVKAVDKAGNERIAEYLPLIEKPFPYLDVFLGVFNLILILLIIIKLKINRRNKQFNNL